jgi:succinate dehydrogenase/fumarate reductase-like Fe-S protein
MNEATILARILRFDAATDVEPYFQEYRVAQRPGMTVASLLQYVYEELDPTLALRNYRCGRGLCGGCKVKVNGKSVKACSTTLDASSIITIEPVDNRRVIRDLAVSI